MEVPFFDLKQPRASLMQVPSGLVSQYAFDQEPALLQVELPTAAIYCLIGHQLVRGAVTGLGLDTLTWRLAPEETPRFPLFANRGLWASYGEVAFGRDLPQITLNARGLKRLSRSFDRRNRRAICDFEDCVSNLRLRAAFSCGVVCSVWALLPAGVVPFPDIVLHEIEPMDDPDLEYVFSIADLLSEIDMAKQRAAALEAAIFSKAPPEAIESERKALLNVRFGKALHQGLLNTLQ